MVQSLLYVSVRRVSDDTKVHDVDDIVAGSRARNAELEITGALVATPQHYAQILEGTTEAIDTLMASIARDPRHSRLLIASCEQKVQRDFHRWSLAYHGDSSYVAELVAAAIVEPVADLPRHAQNIRNLMAMFV